MDNNSKKRTIEVYKVELIKEEKTYSEHIILKELLIEFFGDYSKNIQTQGYDINSSKKCWIDKATLKEYDDIEILEVKINYTKFNKKINIINTTNREIIGYKDLNSGDDEKQHFSIKFFPEKNYALILYEKILDAVPMSSFKKIINNFMKLHFLVKDEYKNIIKPRDIKFNIEPIVSSDFIEAITNLKGINLLRTFITKESLDNDIKFSSDVSRDELELTVKPERKMYFHKNEVINHCEKFMTNGIIKDERILRIVIQGINEQDNPVTLNTDGMKLSQKVNILLDNDNTIDTQDIFFKLKNIIIEQSEQWEQYFNITLDIKDDDSDDNNN